MQAKVEIVDMAYAKQLLEQNTKNRPISRATVERYTADMKAGRWNNNGQGIVITPEGDLLDGQHRLHAIIASQTPIAALIVRGVPAETFVTMDSGKTRSLADVLAIIGHLSPNTLATAVKMAYAYIAGVKITYSPTKSALQTFVEKHPYSSEIAKLIVGGRTSIPKGPLAAVLLIGNERRMFDAEVEQFIEGVVFGTSLFKGDPRLTLREWAADVRAQPRGVMRADHVFGAIARAWNAYSAGRELERLRSIAWPTQASVKINGFDRSLYPDVPDLARSANLVSARSNLPKSQATPALALGRVA